ncbi:MAG: efflux RND transporter periplasmic adaptor subunit [Verrucomicrobiota bacterium]|jgi:membrane fusion protein, heavy metal efflux system
MKLLLRNTINALLLAMMAVVPCGCSNDHKADAAPSAKADNEKGEAKAVAQAGVCKHGAPDKDCFICHPELREKGRLWCKEHNRYEDRCWECHPDAQDKSRLYCKEHSLYEDECFLCHPELKTNTAPAEGKPGASTGSDAKPVAKALLCKEHGVPELECGICHPDLLSQKQPGQGLKVRLRSAESAGKAGVVVSTPGVDTMTQGIEAFAELTFNQNKLAQITPLVGGIVKSVEVDLGSRVKEGDLLARITSVAIGEAQSAYVKALAEDRLRDKTAERERNLRAQRISSEKDLQEAEAAHESAMAAVQQTQQQLMVLGFDEQQIQALADQKGTPGVLEIRAPFAGEIVERTAVRGAMVEMGKPLFTLADTTAMWAMVNIPESLLAKVQVGQKVELSVESLPGQTFTGTLTWLSAKVDDRTRMARGRVEVSNAEGKLKAQMFARARILTSSSDRAVIVPQGALQNVSGTTVVFVKFSADIFEARPVQLGGKRDGRVEIVAGLKPDEQVVVAGSFALKSQFLISRLGAGCVD